MKILIVGNRNHQFIYNYVKHLKKYDDSIVIDILSYETSNYVFPNDNIYNQIITPRIPYIFTRNRYLNYFFRHCTLIIKVCKLEKYDYVHIHYVEKPLQDILPIFLKVIKAKIVTSVWGSDFYKRSTQDRIKIKKLFEKSYKITFTSKRFAHDFMSFYNKDDITSKICFFKLGLEPLDYLDNVTRNDNHTNIMIGYNARHNQCHLEILDSISDSKIQDKNIQLLVPLTYPKDDPFYCDKIKKKLCNIGLSHIVYENFMSDYDVAKMRISTDIFVQLQKTDVLSGAMLEHIAAGSIVITGSWLPYDDLDELGIKLVKVSERSMIGLKIHDVLNNMAYYKRIANKNASIVKDNYKWDNLIANCVKIYD